MSKSPKKKPTQKPSPETGKPEKKEVLEEKRSVIENNKPPKEDDTPPGDPEEDNADRASETPERRSRLFVLPAVVLLVALVGVAIYAATIRSDLDESIKREAGLRGELTKVQVELRKTSVLREGEATAFTEEKGKLEEQVAALESALDSTKTAVGELKDEKKQTTKELAQFKAFSARFKRMIDAGKLEVVFRRGRMVVNLPAQVLFDSGSAELSENGSDALKEVAKILKTVKNKRFLVGGHTDDRKILKAKYDSNWELAAARATVVTKALIKAGIRPWNLAAAGYSQYAPVASNKTDQGRQKNRRIEIILEPNLKDIELPNTRKKKS